MIVKSTNLYAATIAPKTSFPDYQNPDVTGVQAYDNYHISNDGNYLVGIKGNKIKVEKIGKNAQLPKITDEDAEKITYIGSSCVIFVNKPLAEIKLPSDCASILVTPLIGALTVV